MDAEIDAYLDFLNGLKPDYVHYTLRAGGKKFIAVDMHCGYDKDKRQTSVHSFIALEESASRSVGPVQAGDILKAAGFSRPAKGMRGTIFSPLHYRTYVQWTGPAYKRR